jgi:hypothetical protein
MGILVTRGRMQTDDRRLMSRAKLWAKGILSQFEGGPRSPTMPALPTGA